MKIRLVYFLFFAAGILLMLQGCETESEKCWKKFLACSEEVDKLRRDNSANAEKCRREALDNMRKGLEDCFRNLPNDADARNNCIEAMGVICDRELKKCNDEYDKNEQAAQKQLDECYANWKKCLGR